MKVLSKVFKCIIGVPLSILGMIILVVLYVIPSPIKFLRYKYSNFFRESNIKYKFGVTTLDLFKIFNSLTALNVPLSIHQTTGKYVYLKLNTISPIPLVFPSFSDLIYSTKTNEWGVQVDDGFYQSIECAINQEKEDYCFEEDIKLLFLLNK